jgi:SAM-dependent methyltransferase
MTNDLTAVTMKCPEHDARLRVEQSAAGTAFVCERGCSHPVHGGIPRFVPSDMYASSFGLQWNTFRKTQLDSYTGASISRDRLTRMMGGRLDVGGRKVLEAGCGAGRFTELFLREGAAVFAADISSAVEANYENCRHLVDGANYFVCQADIRALPLYPEQFEIVFCAGVIQHTPDPEETINALCRYVAPGGMLVIDHYGPDYQATPSRQMLRTLLLQVPPDAALEFCRQLVELLWPVHRFFWENQHDAVLASLRQKLLELSPVVDYFDAYPQLADQLYGWAVLDTHDTLTDTYKHLRSADQIHSCLADCGMERISTACAGNGVEAIAYKRTAR